MADRYWILGTGTWDATTTTNWSASSGGAGGASVPTAADNVFFDANSNVGTDAFTVTMTTSPRVCNDFTASGLDGVMTLAGTSIGLTVSGSLTFPATNFTRTYTGTTTFNATTTGKTVTTNGVAFGASLIFDGVGGGWTLGSALNYGFSVNQLVLSNGTFDTSSSGNYAVTGGSFSSSNSNLRTINLNASTVTLASTSTAWSMATSTNATFNAGTSTINCTSTNPIFAGGGLTFYNVAFPSTYHGTVSITGTNTFNNLSITANNSASNLRVLCAFGANQTINGTLSTTGTAGNRRIFFSNSIGFTLTINSAPNLTDADFGNTYVVGTAAPISGTRIGNLGSCSGITFSTPKNCYWVTSTSSSSYHTGNNIWSATDAGVGSTDYQPLPQDTAIFTNSRRGSFVSQNEPAGLPYIGAVNCSAVTSAFIFSISGGISVYGNFTLGSGVTSENYSSVINFLGNVNGGSQVVTSAGKQLGSMNINTLNTGNGTVVLADACSATYGGFVYAITVTSGTFNTGGYAVVADAISTSSTLVKTINFGASTLTLASGAPINFSASTNLTFNAGTSTINCSSTNGTLNGSGQTFYNVTFTANNFNYTYAITGTNTFNNLSFAATSGTGNQIITISANQTINGTLTFGGTSEIRRRFVNSSVTGTPRTLTVNSLSANYCDFRDIVIAGVASGISPTNAGDCGGNSGIIFPAPKTVYWNLTGATQDFTATGWSTSSGGTPAAANFPLAQDTAIFDNTGAAGTITIPSTGSSNFWNFGTVDASFRANAMTLTNSANTNIYGNWKYGTGVNSGNTNSLHFSKNGTQTITSNGRIFNSYIQVSHPNANVQLTDALAIVSSAGLIINLGTFDAVSYNVTAGIVSNGSTANRIRMGSGTWSLISSIATVWNCATLPILNPGTSTIVLSNPSPSTTTFAGGGGYYNKLTIGGATGLTTTTITGSNTFGELASTKTVAHTIDFGTTVQSFGKWSVTGTAGNVVTITGTATTNNILGPAVTGVNYLAMGTWGIGTTSPGEFYAGANSTGTAAAPVYRTAAPAPRTLYWVGGTGPWSDTTRWSTSSGGASGAAIPTSLDSVIIDHAGRSTAYSVTVDVGVTAARCANFTMAYWNSGGLVQLAGSVLTYFHGNVLLAAAGVVVTHTGQIQLIGGNSSYTLTNGGAAWGGSGSQLVLGGPNATWTLGSALTIGGSVGLVLNSGTFNTSGYALSAYGIQSSNSIVRTINLSNSTVTVTGTAITFTTSNNLTLNSGTSQINFTSTATTSQLGGLTYYNVNFPGYNGHTINGTNTFNNLTFAGRTALLGISLVNFGANQTINGTLTVGAGLTAAYRTMIRSSNTGTTRILTVNAISSLTDVDFRDITIVATPPFIPSISFDTPGAQTWTVPAGVTSATIKLWGGGGAAGGPGTFEDPGGGGGGGYASKVLTVTPGQVLSFTVGTGGPSVTTNGTASTHAGISAGGGGGGGDGVSGSGGTSSGGDVNTSGSAGQPNIGGGTVPYGGASPNGGAQQNTTNANGNAPGSGGCGANGLGANGRVQFEWSAIPLSLPVTGTRLGDAKGNTNITFPAAKTVFYRQTGSFDWGQSGSSGSWSATSGGSADATQFPLAQDTAVFPAAYPASGSTTTINAAYNIGTIDMSLRTSNTMTLATGANLLFIFGNWINGTGITLSGTETLTFAGRTTQQITSAGRSFTQTIDINTPSGSVTLQDGLTTTSTTTFSTRLSNGTLDLNGYTLSAGQQFGTLEGTKNLTFNGGTLICPTAAFGVSFRNFAPTGFTTTAGTGVGTISVTAATANTFDGGGSTYNCTLNQGGAGALTISGNNTFGAISKTYVGATTINLAATTQTVGAFTAAGTAGNLLTISGTSAASPATLIYTGSGAISGLNYLVPTFIRAYPTTSTWYAGANSTNGGTAGWGFTAAPVPTYSVSGPGPVSEGGGAGFYVTTTNVANGTTLYWTLTPTSGATSADFSTTSGSFPINSNLGFINVNTVADLTTEGTQGFFVSVRTGSTSGTVVQNSNVVSILDTSLTPATTASGNFLVFF